MDGQVDIWSVGVILYEALFGRAPYASGSLEVWRTSGVIFSSVADFISVADPDP
jgi:serine/threonine protein kinase